MATYLPGVRLPSLPAGQPRRRRQNRLQRAADSTGGRRRGSRQESRAVLLHIYDVSGSSAMEQVNQLLRPAGTGLFHAGVEVFGAEWSFGGACCEEEGVQTEGWCEGWNSTSSFSSGSALIPGGSVAAPRPAGEVDAGSAALDFGTGVFSTSPPRECPPHRYRESVGMGLTQMTKAEVEVLLDKLAAEWPTSDYDLLKRNCGHFADALCRGLGVGAVPVWVTNLAGVGAALQDGVTVAAQGAAAAASHAQDRAHELNETYHISERAAAAVTIAAEGAAAAASRAQDRALELNNEYHIADNVDGALKRSSMYAGQVWEGVVSGVRRLGSIAASEGGLPI